MQNLVRAMAILMVLVAMTIAGVAKTAASHAIAPLSGAPSNAVNSAAAGPAGMMLVGAALIAIGVVWKRAQRRALEHTQE